MNYDAIDEWLKRSTKLTMKQRQMTLRILSVHMSVPVPAGFFMDKEKVHEDSEILNKITEEHINHAFWYDKANNTKDWNAAYKGWQYYLTDYDGGKPRREINVVKAA